MERIFLIDGNSYIHRAYHALPPLTNSRGEEVGAVYGFIRMLNKIMKGLQPIPNPGLTKGNYSAEINGPKEFRQPEKPDYLIVCFDYPAPTFRHRQFIEYKATRREIEPGLAAQMPLAKEVVKALNIVSIEKEGYEADDLIATLVNISSSLGEVIIVSGDKDVLQLVSDRVFVLNEPKNTFYNENTVKERYGVGPEKITDIFGLSGDTSDNVPGVYGIGEKTALKLIQQFGSIENLYANLDKVAGKLKENLEKNQSDAFLSKQLVTLDKNVPLGPDFRLVNCRPPQITTEDNPNKDKLIALFKRLEFSRLLPEFLPGETGRKIDCRVIRERNDFEKLIRDLEQCPGFSFDLETTNPNPLLAGIVGISFSFQPGKADYLPLGHNYLGCPEQLNKGTVLEKLKTILENEKIAKYGQNIKYDSLILAGEDIQVINIVFDTMIASYLLNPSRQNHNLEEITLEYLGEKITPIEELIGKGAKQITMDKVEIEKVAGYSCPHAETVLRLKEILEPQLKEKKLDKLFYQVELPLLSVLGEMERNGIRIDKVYFENLSKDFNREITRLEKHIFKISGQEFNLNSPKQLSFILFEKLDLPVIRRTKTGISTDEEVLKTLSGNHELPRLILEYRELQKLQSTYIDGLIELINQKTGRLHTSFNQTVTATGRLSSSEPNLQNIPIRSELGKKIRRGFIPEEGWLFLSADYSQIDLRVLAHLSADRKLVEAFKNNEDVHSTTASEIFAVPIETVSREQRRIAKTINFGIIYGMSAFGLAQQLGISQEEAGKYISDYFDKYAGVKRWIEETLEEARKNGCVSTLLNRVRYLPEINSKNGQVRSFAERAAMNTPVQGTAADIIKVAMIRIRDELRAKNYMSRMLLQVHDDLLLECPQKEIEEIKKLLKKEMEGAIELNIPLIAEIKTGFNWCDLK